MDPLTAVSPTQSGAATEAPLAAPTIGAASARAAGSAPAEASTPASTESSVSFSREALEEAEEGSLPDFGATETEEPEGAEEPKDLSPEKQIEQLKKQIEKLQEQLEDQLARGDEAGARATEARLGSLTRQLDSLMNSSAQQAPAVDPVGGGAPVGGGGGGAPVGGGGGGAPVGGGGGAAPAGGATAAGGPSTFGPSNAPQVDANALARTSPLGQKIAESGQRNCNGTGGFCFRHVGRALRENGIETSGASAYMAADQLARQTDKVREVQMNPQDFPKLPAGAIVVWDRGPGHEHGHISIADGKGGEYSDVYRRQITNYGTKPRVFLPADMQTNTGR